MKELNRRFACVIWVVVASACASAGVPVEEVAPEPSERIGPLDGTNYVMFYGDESGLRRRDTQAAEDVLLVPNASVQDVFVAPDGSASAVVYLEGAVVRVGVIRNSSPGIMNVHEGSSAGTYTVGWSLDGRLGVGYQAAPGETSAIVGVMPDNQIWNFGCSASNRFYAWGNGDVAVVGDARNVYSVNARGCGTITTLPRQGKTDFGFSASGTRVSFKMGGRQPGLYIAQVNGAGAALISDNTFNPQNVHWSPDGTKVAFEIRAREYANVTHVAIHDVTSGQIKFFDRETELGRPIDTNACWSPDGRFLIHERSYFRSGATASYVTRQIVQKTVATNADRVVSEELISIGRGPESFTCWWVGSDQIAMLTADSYDLITLGSSDVFEVPSSRTLLLIQPVTR